MKAKDIQRGGQYYTYVGDERVRVRVVYVRDKVSFRTGRKTGTEYQVERVDNGKLLPKWRTAAALHPAREGPWPGVMQKQEDLGRAVNGEYERPGVEELQEAIVIADAKGSRYNLFVEGKAIAREVGWSDAVRVAHTWMNRNNYWPNVYHVNERGNIDLLDNKGNIVHSWV
jgi:hypothetical protein